MSAGGELTYSVVDGDKWESEIIVKGKGSVRVPFHLGFLGRPLKEKTFEESPREDFGGQIVEGRENSEYKGLEAAQE